MYGEPPIPVHYIVRVNLLKSALKCVAVDAAIDGDPVAAKGLIGICGPRLLYSILLNTGLRIE